MQGFDHVIFHPGTQASNPVFEIAPVGEEHQRNIYASGILLQFFQELKPIDAGDIDFRDDQIDPFGLNRTPGVVAIARRNNLEVCPFKALFQDL